MSDRIWGRIVDAERVQRRDYRNAMRIQQQTVEILCARIHPPHADVELARQLANDYKLKSWGWTGATPKVAPRE